MPTVTKHRNYSNKELLQLLHLKRDLSPLVEELCQRLEAEPESCPVCEADLDKYRKECSDDEE